MFKKKEENKELLSDLKERLEKIEKDFFEEKDFFDPLSFYWMSEGMSQQSLKDRVEELRKDFEYLDKRFDMLTEYLGVEFVKSEEKISDGSELADVIIGKEYCRKKVSTNVNLKKTK